MALPRTSNGTVVCKEQIDKDLLLISVKVDRKLPRFRPGQFAHISTDEYSAEKRWPTSRVFSVANFTDGSTLDFLISRQGQFTSFLIDNVELGRRMAVRGPYGNFEINEDNKHIVLICGGSGISAFSAFFEKLLADDKVANFSKVTLLYGAREKKLLSYRTIINQLQLKHDWFHVYYFVESIQKDVDEYIAGRPNLLYARDSCFDEHSQFYISGGKKMIDHYKIKLSKEFSICEDRIMIDAWE